MIVKINSELVPFDKDIQKLCTVAYKGNPYGCTKFGNKNGCPPRKLFSDFFDVTKDLYVIYTEYHVGKFAEEKRQKYPDAISTYPDVPKKGIQRLKKIRELIKKRHPDWPDNYFPHEHKNEWQSARKWYFIRWWQQIARSLHRTEIETFQRSNINMTVDRCPEALGVNVTGMMANIGITLNWQWPPEHRLENSEYLNNKTYIVSLGGYPIERFVDLSKGEDRCKL